MVTFGLVIENMQMLQGHVQSCGCLNVLFIYLHIYIYGVYNDAASSWECIVTNGSVISE